MFAKSATSNRLCLLCLACMLWSALAAAGVARGADAGVDMAPLPAKGLIVPDLKLAPVVPGDTAWRLGPVRQPGLAALVVVDGAMRTPTGAASFRVDYERTSEQNDPAQPFFGVESGTRRNLYKARGVEFAVRATRPLLAVLVITTSNPERPEERESFFGTFVVGTQWKPLQIPFRSMAPETRQNGKRQQEAQAGMRVLRPDSIEHIGIGLPTGRVPVGSGSLWVGDVRFFR